MEEYTLVRSKRKTLSMSVKEDGSVCVRAPLSCPVRDIQAFVDSHEKWIQKHRSLMEQRANNCGAEAFLPGNTMLYLGEAYPIVLTHSPVPLQWDGEQFLLSQRVQNAQAAFTAWYKAAARTLLFSRTGHYARLMGLEPNKLSITSAKRRWGSCNAKDGICYAFRLICLPMEAIDYIVVHELAHMIELNHSPAFYEVIAKIMPDYKQRVKLLKRFQNELPF